MGVTNTSFGMDVHPAGNVSTLKEMFDYNNAVTDNMYSSLLILVVWSIIFLRMQDKHSSSVSALTASFSTFVLSYIMASGGLLLSEILILNALVMVMSMIWVYSSTK